MWDLGERRNPDLCAEMDMTVELLLAVAVFEKMSAFIVLDDSPFGVDFVVLCAWGIFIEKDDD